MIKPLSIFVNLALSSMPLVGQSYAIALFSSRFLGATLATMVKDPCSQGLPNISPAYLTVFLIYSYVFERPPVLLGWVH
jgi:hypothetical protein